MKKIKDYELYKISPNGFVVNSKTGHTLTPVTRNGYLSVRLYKDKKLHQKSLHKLVYETYQSKVPNGMHINHINGIRNDNRLANLEVCTPKENNDRRLFLRKGEQINTAKLNERQVMEIRQRKANGERSLDLANEYGVGKGTINRLIAGKSWKHLPLLPVDNSFWGNPKKTGAMASKVLNDKYGKEYFAKIAKGKKFKKHCDTCRCTL